MGLRKFFHQYLIFIIPIILLICVVFAFLWGIKYLNLENTVSVSNTKIQDSPSNFNRYIDNVNGVSFLYPLTWTISSESNATLYSGNTEFFGSPNKVPAPYSINSQDKVSAIGFNYGLSSDNNMTTILQWLNSTYNIGKVYTVGNNTHVIRKIGKLSIYVSTLTDPDLGYFNIYFFKSPISGNVVQFLAPATTSGQRMMNAVINSIQIGSH